MRTIIDRIIAFCEMRAKVLGIVVANTEKTLRESAADGRTFEERLDEEVKQTAAYIGGRLKEHDEALDETADALAHHGANSSSAFYERRPFVM